MKIDSLNIIYKWLDISVSSEMDPSEDLHIDIVNNSFKEKALWVAGGIECYFEAKIRVTEKKYHGKIALGFSLKSEEKKLGVNFKNENDLAAELDCAPPSIYYIRSVSNLFLGNSVILHDIFKIDNSLQIYLEFKSSKSRDNSYSRSFWII